MSRKKEVPDMADTADPTPRVESHFDPTGTAPSAVAKAATFLKSLAHEGRLEILCKLADGPSTVGGIEEALGMSQSAVSQLLMRLRSAGVVEASRSGRSVTYRLATPEVVAIIALLRERYCPED